ncbi:putative Serine/threonine protein kinase STE11 B (STE11B) [Monocercomonoides exilis]|uniref:putative Serine/threonine protein kinase STE11 B (STE11B) n=1 Tax=Monocercomonoides exilis TaxID=2049356 RepID=UPI00355A3BF3|nr:putative Serine/threonine protein kinase STE11 B (STE11B) [Monocercomonoides exilis]|eukprot:MONOS_3264.1-p1 / transcript=MONOS_3264.1 / gene=MONOS_3264 / organism=Monocercomonoides_exilis_PA203 / gene_product=Serine/threonine protein kinase STE11 B (STE11B) / transcript_product=Serine/threonine protein kinase STE11 B (STE11B) / location=Mono_scaffold00075:100581-103528(+) / protein_length=592 / sequence_SO=supercontig / SO=protein_coding / is_pseudo=false
MSFILLAVSLMFLLLNFYYASDAKEYRITANWSEQTIAIQNFPSPFQYIFCCCCCENPRNIEFDLNKIASFGIRRNCSNKIGLFFELSNSYEISLPICFLISEISPLNNHLQNILVQQRSISQPFLNQNEPERELYSYQPETTIDNSFNAPLTVTSNEQRFITPPNSLPSSQISEDISHIMSTHLEVDGDFGKLFFSTPTAFSSVVITDPDLPPPSTMTVGEEEEEGVLDTSSYHVDKLKVSSFPSTPHNTLSTASSSMISHSKSQQKAPPNALQQKAQSSSMSQSAHLQTSPQADIVPAATGEPLEQSQDQLYLKRGDIIGRGSFGTVYKCLDLKTGKLLADKEYIFESSGLEQQIANAEREILIMQHLVHPNVVQYMGCQRNGNILDVFQEFVTGGSIARLLSTFGTFPEPLVQVYTKQITEGLAYLHDHKIVHRDIKSANCLVTGEGVIKLADFGCSKTIETVMSYGQGCATLCGTPYYMAPEVIRQQRNVGRRSDIWSLGCTVIEMLTGKPPYSDIKNATACIFKIASSSETPPIPKFASPELTDFLKRCFVRDPVKRATSRELLRHPFLRREYDEDWYTMENEEET